MKSYVTMVHWIRVCSLTAMLLGARGVAWAEVTPLLDITWAEARTLSKTWKTGDVKLQVRKGTDVYVTNGSLIIVGQEFLDTATASPDAHDKLLFALLHELWHVHQLAIDATLYETIEQRPMLECAADARAAFTMALQAHSALSLDSPAGQRASIANVIAAIPEIPTRFSNVNTEAAQSLKHLNIDQRRFASQIGILQAIAADTARDIRIDPPGMEGKLLRQLNGMFDALTMLGDGDQERMNGMCSYIANSNSENKVRVGPQKIEMIEIEGRKRPVTRYKVENLLDRPVTYSFLQVDGVAKLDGSDSDTTDFTSIRRTDVKLPARGVAEFSTFPRWRLADLTKVKYLPSYSFGTLDRVVVTGKPVPPQACFDEAALDPESILDLPTKKAIRIGQAALEKFTSIRGEQDMDSSSALSKTFWYTFDAQGKRSGYLSHSATFDRWSATLNIYSGEEKTDALKIIDGVEAYAKRYCPAPADPTFPIYWRDSSTGSLHIRLFTTGSSAQLALFLPSPEDQADYPEISVTWLIERTAIDD